ncbi:hypothetical protein [Kitasatospora sp. GAS204B]|uniref:hypothetical protein n=1 Tax=unclassified Kitasatospora TaxID=2633591 RepID=UPI0024735F92|nr:hypothetical protein [Kitasatospora sp. GAS204B]MDH6122402.1 YVTN family beta-propeller protein [Kitasatospora sp. GAS204B]
MNKSLALAAVAVTISTVGAAAPGATAAAPSSASCLPGGLYAFVVNADNPSGARSSLAVLDTTSHEVVRTTTGLGLNPSSIAITHDGKKAYVANFGGLPLNPVDPSTPPQTVSVVDTGTGNVLGAVAVGRQPVQVALTPDGRYAYVVNSGTTEDPGSITVIDTASDRVIDTISDDGLLSPAAIAFAPDGTHAYVTSAAKSTLAIIDTAARKVTSSVGLGPQGRDPQGVAVAPDGRQVYVAGSVSRTVITVDAATARVSGAPIKLPGWGLPEGIAVTPDGSRAYVTEAASDEVAVVDTATATALPNTITVGRNPMTVAFTPDGRQAYVASSLGNPRGLSVIDTATNTVTAAVNTGSGPSSVAFAAVPADGTCQR